MNNKEDKGSPITARTVWFDLGAMVLLGVLVPLLVYLDMVALFGEILETSLTELCQLFLLIPCSWLFARGAAHHGEAKGYLALMATTSLIMAIRESDGHLDVIAQGFWLYAALVCLLIGAVIVWRNRKTVRPGFVRHYGSRYGILTFFGLVTLIVFSRAFGTGDLWRAIMADAYTWQIKGAIQEGLELFAYGTFAFGTVGSSLNGFR